MLTEQQLTINNKQLNMPYLPWLLAILLTLLLLWLAWRRPERQRLVWRLLASAVAGISLALLLFPPTYMRAVNPSSAILLTDGFDADTLAALLRQTEPNPQVYTFKTTADNGMPVTDLYTLQQAHPALQTLHILGSGLDKSVLQALKNIALVPHLSAAPAGVQAVHWPEIKKLGETIEIAGKYKNQTKATTWLYLQAAGQLQDSIEVKTDSTYTFKLRYTPKQTGRFAYIILAKTETQTDTLGQVPVQVAPVKELGILLLAASPSFEFKFLKNHLGQLQHRVALHTTISKDISQSEWLSMPQVNLNKITPKLLQQFDVVVTEPQALQGLSTTEKTALEKAVTADGLGILTIATAPASNRSTAFFTGFQTKRLSQQDARNTHASWAGNATATAVAAPYTLVNTTAVTGLVKEQGSNLLAGAKQAGWGKVAMSFVPQTFPWQLEGKDQVYASYWANLLSAIAKEEVLEKFWQLTSPQAPQPDKPVILFFTDYTSEDGATTLAATITSLADTSSINLALAQNPVQPEQFSGTFWPRRSGWYQVQTADAPPYFFFVQNASSWPFQSIKQRQQATQAYVAKQSINPAKAAVTYKEEQVPLIWFFILFVLSSGFLWLEEKL